MARLDSENMEKFCQIYARNQGEYTKAEMVRMAGYGCETSDNKYFAAQASRLLADKKVVFRIQEIRTELGVAKDEDEIRDDIIRLVYGVMTLDITKYMRTEQAKAKNGLTMQNTVVDNTDYSQWDRHDRCMITGFDSRTGNPIFLDKKWAIEFLAKLVINKKDSSVAEDLVHAFASAGLFYGCKDDEALSRFVENTKYTEIGREDI